MSALDHDYFVTCDRCLKIGWLAVIIRNEENRKALEQKHQIPEIILAKTVPHSVAQKIIQKVS